MKATDVAIVEADLSDICRQIRNCNSKNRVPFGSARFVGGFNIGQFSWDGAMFSQ